MSTTKPQTFEEAVAEFMARSREQLDQESEEHLPPWSPSPYQQSGPPYEYAQRFDARLLTAFSQSIGDNNPLFTDPEYGKNTKYGCQIAPGPILALVRYPSVHGAKRPWRVPTCQLLLRRGLGVLRCRKGRVQIHVLQINQGDI